MTGFKLKYEYNIIKETVLKPVREMAGIGSSPEQFSTNANGSIHAMLKAEVDYKHSQLPVFVQKMRELHIAREQQREFEMALINKGYFKLKDQYKFMIVPEDKWCKMSENARKAHLNKFQNLTITEEPCTSMANPFASGISIQFDSLMSSILL